MTLQQINYAMTAARCGSMNKAAEQLFLSQPTLTSAIRELETELGIKIFHRTSRGVSLTEEGADFLSNAGRLYQEYELLLGQYRGEKPVKQKFGISSQHYSFVVKAFVEMVQHYGTLDYEFAIRETRTREVFRDVATGKSEIGILQRSAFNSKVIDRMLQEYGLSFTPLIDCHAFIYVWKGHPLAAAQRVTYDQLLQYPCLCFEQEETDSTYLSEEILIDREYSRKIYVNDRASMLNLMIGLQGYTLCSGIICEPLNGTDYITIPYEGDEDNPNETMEIGYLVRRGTELNELGRNFVKELKESLRRL